MDPLARRLSAAFLLAVLAGLGIAAFFFSGLYSVAADRPDPGAVDWALIHVRQASIAWHATARPPSPLDDAALVQAGARAYADLGCIACHGGPGVKPARFSEGLNPSPNLKRVIKGITPQELFWVVKNGIKMSGMPSFGVGHSSAPDEEIWSIVAFLKKVPAVSEADYKAWSTIPPADGHPSP